MGLDDLASFGPRQPIQNRFGQNDKKELRLTSKAGLIPEALYLKKYNAAISYAAKKGQYVSMTHRSFRHHGFTLIEIMIVIAIIAILASITVPSFMRARGEAQLDGCIQNEKAINAAIEIYLVRHKATTTLDIDTLVEAKCLKEAPKCPATGTCCYSITACGKPGKEQVGAYAIKCESNAHGNVGCDDGYPKLVTNDELYYTKK